MAIPYYQQQSFLIGSHNELYSEEQLDHKISFIEKNIPLFYEKYYSLLKGGEIRNHDLYDLSQFMIFTFNPNSYFCEVKNCSREVQVQAFNLFNECFYSQIRRGNVFQDDFYCYIWDVITFAENTLNFVPSNVSSKIDFSAKGLIKSELYKYHNAHIFSQNS